MNIDIRRIHRKDRKSSYGIKDPLHNEAYLQMESEVMASVEASLIFTLIWSIGLHFKPIFFSEFQSYLYERIQELSSQCKYYTKRPDDFGCGIYRLLQGMLMSKSKVSMMDYCFNHLKRRWEEWGEINLYVPEGLITDFTSCDLGVKELVYLNKDLLTIESFQNQIQNETAEIYLLPKNHIHCETLTSKKMNYFMNYFLVYSRKVMMLSCQQNGKSNFVKDKVWNLLSKPEYSAMQIGMTRTTGIVEVI